MVTQSTAELRYSRSFHWYSDAFIFMTCHFDVVSRDSNWATKSQNRDLYGCQLPQPTAQGYQYSTLVELVSLTTIKTPRWNDCTHNCMPCICSCTVQFNGVSTSRKNFELRLRSFFNLLSWRVPNLLFLKMTAMTNTSNSRHDKTVKQKCNHLELYR